MEQIELENARLKEELAKLKATAEDKNVEKLKMKIGPKGGLSVYVLKQRFPVTLYKEDWKFLLREENVEKILHYLNEHDDKIK